MLTVLSETNLDVLNAKIHAQRAAMYEKERLARLCELKSFVNLAGELYPEAGIENHLQLQKRLAEDHFSHLAWIPGFLGGKMHQFFVRLLRRYQLENIKVIFRGFHARRSPALIITRILTLPHPFDLPAEAMIPAADAKGFAAAIDDKEAADIVQPAVKAYLKGKKPFYFETALDRAWFADLLGFCEKASRALKECLPLLTLDMNVYLAMLVLRARENYNVEFETIAPYLDLPYAPPLRRLRELYDAGDPVSAAEHLHGELRKAVTEPPETLEKLELMLASEQQRQANRAYYAGGVSMLAAVGWFYLKRIELANLIRLVEAYRYELGASEKKQMMVPPLE